MGIHVKRDLSFLNFVNCELRKLFYVKRDQDTDCDA